jgi:NADH-quinone oxidoreductase subunit M
LILWLPALAAIVIWLLPKANEQLQRIVALVAAIATFGIAASLVAWFDFSSADFQFVDALNWFPPEWGIRYAVGVDGLSLGLVLLATFLTPVALVASWGQPMRDSRSFQALLLVLTTALIGIFTARDLVLFYIMFELSLIPTALLVGLWGGANRIAAAGKFFIYTFSGSVFMLLSIIGVYILHGQATGTYTADLQALTQSVANRQFVLDPMIERLLFAGFFLAFAIKAPLWPFHTWLPTLHAEAPSSGAVDLAIMLLKLGTFGLIRFNLQLFPDAATWAAPAVGVLAVISILYSAMVAYSQTDVKRVLAYSSISHMGFILLGIFSLQPVGIAGALIALVASVLTGGALFLVAGMLYSRFQSFEMSAFGGLWKSLPTLGSFTLVLVLGAIGLPGLIGFIGEFAALQGTWLSGVLGWQYALPAVIGVILSAAYLLRMYRLTFMGDVTVGAVTSNDLDLRERSLLVLVVVPTVLLGLVPTLLSSPMQPVIARISQTLAQALASLP